MFLYYHFLSLSFLVTLCLVSAAKTLFQASQGTVYNLIYKTGHFWAGFGILSVLKFRLPHWQTLSSTVTTLGLLPARITFSRRYCVNTTLLIVRNFEGVGKWNHCYCACWFFADQKQKERVPFWCRFLTPFHISTGTCMQGLHML